MTRFFAILGPGIIFAGAAIGVSHLVQSTRAGAEFGFSAAIAILLAGLLKFPFFEFGARYSSTTGQSLLVSYREQLRSAFPVFLVIFSFLAIATAATVTLVTAGLLGVLLKSATDSAWLVLAVVATCCILISGGGYRFIDTIMKLLVTLLGLLTIVAVILAFLNTGGPSVEFTQRHSLYSVYHLGFLLALMGWMPAPIDVAILSSLWSVEKRKVAANTTRESIFDFRIGYCITIALAFAFLALGTLNLYGSSTELPSSSVAFATVLIDLYRNSLGHWSGTLIATLAFATMLSTTLAVLDGYSRALSEGWGNVGGVGRGGQLPWLAALAAGVMAVLLLLQGQMRLLVDAITIVAFLSAPLFAWLHLQAVTGESFPAEQRPGRILMWLSYVGLIFLVFFSLIFVWTRFS